MSVLQKAVRLMDALARADGFVTLARISTETELPRSSAHRLLDELTHAGLVRRRGAEYGIGPKCLLWGEAAGAAFDLREAAELPMRRLCNRVDESVHLYVRDGGVRVCIAAAEGTQGLRRFVRIGEPLPLRVGAAGKLLLAFAGEEIIARELALAAEDERLGRFPKGPGQQLEAALERIRAQEWAISVDEREEGVSAVAAPVRDHRGEVAAALVVSGPTFRLTPDVLVGMLPLIREASQRISSL